MMKRFYKTLLSLFIFILASSLTSAQNEDKNWQVLSNQDNVSIAYDVVDCNQESKLALYISNDNEKDVIVSFIISTNQSEKDSMTFGANVKSGSDFKIDCNYILDNPTYLNIGVINPNNFECYIKDLKITTNN